MCEGNIKPTASQYETYHKGYIAGAQSVHDQYMKFIQNGMKPPNIITNCSKILDCIHFEKAE
jgi:hypothetical protein